MAKRGDKDVTLPVTDKEDKTQIPHLQVTALCNVPHKLYKNSNSKRQNMFLLYCSGSGFSHLKHETFAFHHDVPPSEKQVGQELPKHFMGKSYLLFHSGGSESCSELSAPEKVKHLPPSNGFW